jgi:NDP-sugar pyrophosphorylase family protein
MKKELIDLIPEDTFFNATDLIELCIAYNKKVISYNSSAYWLDIGTPNDFEKAQIDIIHLGL